VRRKRSGGIGEVAVVGGEAGEDDLSLGTVGERLRDREQVIEAVLVPDKDQDRTRRSGAWVLGASSGSWRRIACSSSRRAGDGSMPSSATNVRRVVRYTSSASACRPAA
jgi:hypothetical protein